MNDSLDDSPEELQPPSVLTSDTENATQVRPDDAPAYKKQKFQRLRAYNTGLWNGPKRENKEAIRRQDDLQRFDAVAGQLGLTDRQKERGRRLLDDLDFHQVGVGVDTMIFSVCVLVANDEIEGGKRYWPHPETTDNDERFEEVADSLGIGWKKQLSVVQRIDHRLDL